MYSSIVLYVLAASALLSFVTALTQFEYLGVAKDFADAMLSSRNAEIAQAFYSTLFAEDVTGTVDLSTNFDGRELASEYVSGPSDRSGLRNAFESLTSRNRRQLFGLFVKTAENKNDPALFGVPISYNITAAVVQHSTVSASIKFQFYYPTLNRSFPIQIDAFFLVNEQRQIQQYDASFRRWAWASDVIMPLLIPSMAANINIPDTNATFVLQQYLAQKVCGAAMTNCNGNNRQYESMSDCMEYVLGVPLGKPYRMAGQCSSYESDVSNTHPSVFTTENSLICRALHMPMLPYRPSVHCSHVGRTGGDMCITRDYDQVVLDSHCPQGWLAPKAVRPEDAYLVKNLQAVSGAPLDPLLALSMNAADSHSWTPDTYPTAILGYLLFYYLVSNLVWNIYHRRSQAFPTLNLEHQKNVIMYTMSIIFTTIALALELAATPLFVQEYHLWEIKTLRTAGVLTSALYIFELVYRLKMRPPLFVHHILTIVAVSFTVAVLEYTQDPTLAVSAVIWLFQATTEQATFLGLIGYRLKWRTRFVSGLLRFAAFQTIFVKTASLAGILVYWGLHQNRSERPMDIAWSVVVWLVSMCLLVTQFWGSYVTYAIGSRLARDSVSPSAEDVSLSFGHSEKLDDHQEDAIGNEATTKPADGFSQQRTLSPCAIPLPESPGSHATPDSSHPQGVSTSGCLGYETTESHGGV